MSDFVPEGWLLSEAEELYSRMRVPQVYDRNLVDQSGKYPVLDQSENGCVGYLNSKPEFECSPSSPLTTFANHTCAVRQMTRSFGVIQNVFPLKAKAHVSQEFLFQILKGAIPQNGYKGHYPDLREKLFLTPPLPEQQKIATILSSVDDVIEKTHAQIDKLKDLKTGMMQELLTKGIGHTEFKDSPVGLIPAAWEVTHLGAVVMPKGIQTGPFGSQLHAHEYVDWGVPVVMPRDMKGNKIDPASVSHIPLERAVELDKHRVEVNDFLFARRGDIGRFALVDKSNEGWVCGTGCLKVRMKPSVNPIFMASYLTLKPVIEWLNLNAVGQTMLNLNTSILSDLPVVLPSEQEQTIIGEAIVSLDNKVALSSAKLDSLQIVKKALMQDLLTGKVRVKLSELDTEAAN